jgi:hypothetical protein
MVGILDKLRGKKEVPATAVPSPQTNASGVDILERMMAEDKPLTEVMAKEFADKLTNKDFLYMFSDLNQDQRSAIIHLHIISEYFVKPYCLEEEKPKAQNLINALCMLTVSKNREGRRELVEMIIGLRGGVGALLPQRQQEKRGWLR